MKVAIGRYPEGVTLNPMEYVVDCKGEIRLFDSIKEAKYFLIFMGIPKRDLNKYHYVDEREIE